MDAINKIKDFYNRYASREWERLDRSPYDRLNYMLHMDFIKSSLQAGLKVLDAGCGAGRFCIEFARQKCRVTLYDISEIQLEIAVNKMKEAGLSEYVERVQIGDISNMNTLTDNYFDISVCYGAPLNYLYDNYKAGIKELYRVTKPGGKVFVSVNNRLGVIRSLMGRQNFDITNFLGNPDYWMIDQVVDTGNLSEHPEVAQPPRHMFEAKELRGLFEDVGFTDIHMGSSPCISAGLNDKTKEIYNNPKAWNTLVNLELKSYTKETTLDLGEFLMLSAIK